MAEQVFSLGPRDVIGAALVRRAQQDSAFKAELMRDPRAVVERELGLPLPRRLRIEVHEEQSDALHLVLPLPPMLVNEQIIARMELGDREVQGFADKNDPSPDNSRFVLAGAEGNATN